MDSIHLFDKTCSTSSSRIDNSSGVCDNSNGLLNSTVAQSSPQAISTPDLIDLQDDIILGDDEKIKTDKKRISKRISIDSMSPSSILKNVSLIIGPTNKLSSNQIHKSLSSIKTSEPDALEERDIFSPVSVDYSSNKPLDEVFNRMEYSAIMDNNMSHMQKVRTTSKEDKQRQNEEIVVMETSSISSETGTWESVFPQRINLDIKGSCRDFLENERSNCINCSYVSSHSYLAHQPKSISNASSAAAACSIDASTLVDESETGSPSLARHFPEIECFSPKPSGSRVSYNPNIRNEESPNKSQDSDKDSWHKNRHLETLETFHHSFELCKAKRSPKVYSSSSSCGDSSEENKNNLSDEEKLLKCKNSNKSIKSHVYAIDQYVNYDSEPYHDIFRTSTNGKDNSAQEDIIHINEQKIVRLGKDQERKQGNLVFQNSVQQFSGHLINRKIPFSEQNVECFNNPIISWPNNHKTNYESTNNFTEPRGFDEIFSLRFQSESEIPISCIIPDTPHNSIMRVNMSGKSYLDIINGRSINKFSDLKISKRTLRCDELAPIVSGGASIKDFTPKHCDSPPVRRKTGTCPILSGGLGPMDLTSNVEQSSKMKERFKNSTTSWVVDMSGCKNGKRRSASSSPSTETTIRSIDGSVEEKSTQKRGLGYYVSLNDLEPSRKLDCDTNDVNTLTRSLHESFKKSTGFYVDLSGSENSQLGCGFSRTYNTASANGKNKDKTKLENTTLSKRELLSLSSKLSNSLYQKTNIKIMSPTESLITRSTSNTYNTKKLDSTGEMNVPSSDKSKRPFHQFPESKSRISQATYYVLEEDEAKLNSLNTNDGRAMQFLHQEQKRSASCTVDKRITNIFDKIPLISKTSSMSFESSISPFEVSETGKYSNSVPSVSIYSYVGENDAASKKLNKHRWDVQINETFDISSLGSLTDGGFSKESSHISKTDTEGLTFQQNENVCVEPSLKEEDNRPFLMELILEVKEISSPKKQHADIVKYEVVDGSGCKSSTHTMETLHASIEKQKQLLETVTEHVETNSNFVKLADMDKPINGFELHSPETVMSKSAGSHRHISKLFQDRSIGNNILNITSSVGNLKSLTRLFPHLSKEFSSSAHAEVSFDMCSHGPNEQNEYAQFDLSAESSLASSISRSGMDGSSISNRQPRKLGEDLLKMFLQEIATDVVIEVNGRRIKAHKCILRSRCQYFAAMLAGDWVHSTGNVISLVGYTYSTVHFALCHIYSGASHPPEGTSLMELAALADLLGLEGLKEVTAHALKMNYCHNFHKPCSGCIEGILQVLPVALNHALDDLYRKCLKWTCRHYLKVWPSRTFSQLPSDLLSRCRQQLVARLTSESVLETILGCDHLISQMASCRWAVSIANLIRNISDAACNYIRFHFSNLIASDSFLSLGHDKFVNIPRLESILLRIASSLTPDQACRSYQRVTRLNAVLAAKVNNNTNMTVHNHEFENNVRAEDMDWNEEFIRLVNSILSAIEQCLIRQCSRAMRFTSWQRMDFELRKKIQQFACFTESINFKRVKPVSKQVPLNTNNRTQDLYKVKLAIQAHSKRVLGQDLQFYKATHAQTHSYATNFQTKEKLVQGNNELNNPIGKPLSTGQPGAFVFVSHSTRLAKDGKPKVLGYMRAQSEDTSCTKDKEYINSVVSVKLSDIRPRYLEPRKSRMPLKNQSSSVNHSMKGDKQLSSSDSSKISSPGMHFSVNRNRKVGPKSINMSLDSLASPSKRSGKLKDKIDKEIFTDSLVDSMMSSMTNSMKTAKTISQKSLTRSNVNVIKEITIKNNKIFRSNPLINKENQALKISGNEAVKNKLLTCQKTSKSSPSSLTKKLSLLSSATSSVNSPCNDFKNRSASAPAGQSTIRNSFLSAKSREILARKSSILSIQSSKNTSVVKNAGEEKIALKNFKSRSGSSIPTRRQNQLSILHLRRKSKLTQNTISNPTMSSQLKNVSKNISVKTKNEKSFKNLYANKKVQEKIELITDSSKEIRIETKLERSSTFCKEA